MDGGSQQPASASKEHLAEVTNDWIVGPLFFP